MDDEISEGIEGLIGTVQKDLNDKAPEGIIIEGLSEDDEDDEDGEDGEEMDIDSEVNIDTATDIDLEK